VTSNLKVAILNCVPTVESPLNASDSGTKDELAKVEAMAVFLSHSLRDVFV
jgi:hypothetical protein